SDRRRVSALKPLYVGAIRSGVTKCSAVAGGDVLVHVACASTDEGALRIARVASDDVDYPVHCIGAPNRAAWTADNFNVIYILEQHVLGIPEHSGVEQRIDTAAVHHHEKLVGGFVGAKATRGDGVVKGVPLRDVEVGGEAQSFWQTRSSGATDVFIGDDVD